MQNLIRLLLFALAPFQYGSFDIMLCSDCLCALYVWWWVGEGRGVHCTCGGGWGRVGDDIIPNSKKEFFFQHHASNIICFW